MNIYVKQTNELTHLEINEIIDLLNRNLFENSKKFSKNHFYKKYRNNFLGYSFHGLLKKNNIIIGLYSVLPEKFYFNSLVICGGQSVDTLIDKKFRGNLFNFRKLANTVYDEIKKKNFQFVYGVPNKNIYLIRKKILKWHDITYTNLYFLFSHGYIQNFLITLKKLTNNFFNHKLELNEIETRENFIKSDKDELVKIKNTEFIFRNIKNNNKNYAYILKVLPSNSQNIDVAFNYLKSKRYDRVVFITNRNLKLNNAFKFPMVFNKRKILICGKILDDTNEKLIYNNLKAIKFDLINLDIINPN